MEKRGLFTLFLVFLFLFVNLNFVFATSTLVKVSTYPNHDLNINFLKPAPNIELYESFNLKSGDDGIVEFTFSTEASVFDASVFVMEDGQKVTSAKFEDLTLGEPIHLKVFPGKSEVIKNYKELEEEATKNTTVVNETNQTINQTDTNTTIENETTELEVVESDQVNPDQSTGITGSVTSEDSGEGGIFSNTLIYFIVGFLIIGVVIVTGALKLKTIKKEDSGEGGTEKEIKVKKLSEKLKEMKETKKEPRGDYEKAIEEAEQKIKEAQKELTRLKNADRMDELKKDIEKKKKELEDLEKDSD